MALISVCTVLILLVLAFSSYKSNIIESPLGYKGQRRILTNNYLFLFIAILVVVSTLRYGFIDTYAYKIMYRSARNDLEYVNSGVWGVEAGWLYVLYLLNFISSSPKLMLFLSALIINIAFVTMFKKYSVDVGFSLYLYFCLMYLDTNNGLRQLVATAITILAFPLLKNKKFIWYAILIYLAYLLHNSAMYCGIVAFLAYGKPFNIKVKAFLVFAIFLLLMPGVANSFIGDTFSDTKYSDYLEMSGGMSFLRALITGIIPGFLAISYILNSQKLEREIEFEEGIILNFLLLNTSFVIMGSSMSYWNRMGFYTSFAPIIMMPKLIYEFFDEKEHYIVKTVVYLCYFFYFCYNIYVNIDYGAMASFYADFSWS